jgi:hypothetical protein
MPSVICCSDVERGLHGPSSRCIIHLLAHNFIGVYKRVTDWASVRRSYKNTVSGIYEHVSCCPRTAPYALTLVDSRPMGGVIA